MKVANIIFTAILLFVSASCGHSNQNKAQQTESASETEAKVYAITDSCAGPFKIGEVIPDSLTGFTMTDTMVNTVVEGESYDIPTYIYKGEDGESVKITPIYDTATGKFTDRIGEIIIDSNLFRTERGIGIKFALNEFMGAYPDSRIWFTHESDMYVIETPQLKNVQFLLDGKDYTGMDPRLSSTELVMLDAADFKKGAKIKFIRILGK